MNKVRMGHCRDNSLKELCERDIPDRRHRPTPALSRYTLWGGRRKKVRRAGEKRTHLFVDLYSTRLLFLLVTIISLSCMDAYLTLLLIEKGKVIEANPVMAALLPYGAFSFIFVKFIVTAAALLVLCLFKNARITRISLPLALKIYLCVIAYEIYLYLL
jgi:hypothetical protein